MKKICVFLFCLFCYFSLSMNVFAKCSNDDSKKYLFYNNPSCISKHNCDFEGGAKDEITTAITVAGGFDIELVDFHKYTDAGGTVWDKHIVKSYYIRGLDCGDYDDYGELIVERLKGIKMSSSNSRSIYEFLRDSNKCTTYANSAVCNAVKNYQNTVHYDSDKETVRCSIVPTAPSDSPFDEKTLELMFVYNLKDSSKTDFYSGVRGQESTSESMTQNGNTFYLHSDGKPYNTKEKFIERLVKYYDDYKSEHGDFPACNKNLLKLCRGIKDKDKWYLLFAEDDCASGVTQELGDDASSDIKYSTEETKYAHSIFGDILEILDCKTLLGGEEGDSTLLDIIKFLLNAIKILIPIILLVLGSIDFIKAIFAQDEGAIKKAQATFIKRLIIAVVIFLIPSVLKALLNIASGIWPNVITPDSSGNFFCGIL